MKEGVGKRIPKDILSIITENDYFVLLTHIHPDGDALGSMLGMAEILRSFGKQVICYADEPVSYIFEFLPDADKICNDLDEVFSFIAHADSTVVTISLDCGGGERIGRHNVEFLNNKPFVVIDHHRAHKTFGDYRWVEPSASSTGEMVYELAKALRIPVTLKCAYDLFVAISTDTGSFRYEATSARTLEIASDLVECGVRPEEISNRLHDNYTLGRLKLLALVLGTLQLEEEDQVGFVHATQDMFRDSGASNADAEGFVDFPRSLHFVKVAVFLKEIDNDLISVSLRAKGDCDVSEVAKFFGGGGHRNAAGFKKKNTTISQLKSEMLPVLRQQLYSLS